MRRVLLALVLAGLLAGSAAAATIRGTAHADRIAAAFGGPSSVTCGAGRDLVVADRLDHVARDCEVVVRRLSFDPFDDPASQHETALEPDSFAFGSKVVAAFQVGRFQDGGSSGIGFAVSADAGRTWRNGILPGLGRASDPSVAYDAAHGVWLTTNLAISPERVISAVVSRSADGRTWGTPITITPGPAVDKEWIACDNGATSPFRGRCYVLYTDDALHRIDAQTSTDGGLTWSAPLQVTGELVGVQPEVEPDGTLVVVIADIPSDRSGTIVSFRSTDGGASFGPAVRVAQIQWRSPPRMRAIPLPSTGIDAAGTVYTAWHDCRFRSGCAVNDIVVSSSTDGGQTWTEPVRVPIDGVGSGVDHFISGLDADQSRTGRLALVYDFFQPGSCARGACRLEAGFVSSSNGGATWSRAQQLDAQPMSLDWLAHAAGGQMVGDYFSTSFAAGRAVPVFTLASPPRGKHLREGVFAASLPVG